MSGRKMHTDKPVPSCKNHPAIPAIPGKDLCPSCDHYGKLAPKVMGNGKAPKKP